MVVVTINILVKLPLLSVEPALVVRSVSSPLVVPEELEEARPTRKKTTEHKRLDVYCWIKIKNKKKDYVYIYIFLCLYIRTKFYDIS